MCLLHAFLYILLAYRCSDVTAWCCCLSTYSADSCLGPGFTETIPARQEWSKYSTTVVEPGDAVIYPSLSFACNGTLQSLTILLEVRGSVYRYQNQYLHVWVLVWRFNETGYYTVSETSIAAGGQRSWTCNSILSRDQVLLCNITILPQREVLARDILGFRLSNAYGLNRGRLIYQHLPSLLFKPGPSPGTFIPIVSAKLVASSGPVTGELDYNIGIHRQCG